MPRLACFRSIIRSWCVARCSSAIPGSRSTFIRPSWRRRRKSRATANPTCSGISRRDCSTRTSTARWPTTIRWLTASRSPAPCSKRSPSTCTSRGWARGKSSSRNCSPRARSTCDLADESCHKRAPRMGVSKGYDYVIVGGGSAGCVLANRLSEDDAASVLLIEAGGRDLNPLIHVPLGMGEMHEYDMFNWGYSTEPEPNMHGRKVEAMRGKVLGGSSSINVMAYTRGHRGDYDRWAQKGARGWSYADVLPYFKRCERWEGGENRWRGGAGPVGTEFARTADPLYDAWMQAALAAGFPVTDDYNGKQQEGFGRGQYTIRDGYRSSAASAYLKPARKRPNLEVATRAHATRLLMQGMRASGVEYRKGGRLVRVEAEREVILSAGAFNTPPLLMLSGIGPTAHLRDMGIEPMIDLPVGKNLQD